MLWPRRARNFVVFLPADVAVFIVKEGLATLGAGQRAILAVRLLPKPGRAVGLPAMFGASCHRSLFVLDPALAAAHTADSRAL